MAATVTTIELVLHSADANWDRTRWDEFPDDGNRYEIIDGVLYMSTALSPFHQWISRQVQRLLYRQLDDQGLGITLDAPVGRSCQAAIQCSQTSLCCNQLIAL